MRVEGDTAVNTSVTGNTPRALGSTTNHSMFEALFERRLKPSGAFAEELRAAGYDALATEATYPTEIWTTCLEIARKWLWAPLPVADAYRAMGRVFGEGFLETAEGRLLAEAIGHMSPARFVQRIAIYLRLGRNDTQLTFDLTRDEPGWIDAQVHNPAAVPGTFVAGIIEAAYARMGVTWKMTVDQRTPTDYVMAIRWEPIDPTKP